REGIKRDRRVSECWIIFRVRGQASGKPAVMMETLSAPFQASTQIREGRRGEERRREERGGEERRGEQRRGEEERRERGEERGGEEKRGEERRGEERGRDGRKGRVSFMH